MFNHLRNLNYANKMMSMLYFMMGGLGVYLIGQTLAVDAGVVFLIVPTILTLTMSGLGVFFWTLGSKIGNGQWRTGQIIAAGLSLASFPLGTVYGAYALWVLFSEKGGAEFREAQSLTMEFQPFAA